MTGPEVTSPAAVPVLRNRNFRRFWIGETASVVGASTMSVLLPILAVTELDAGAAWMGAITAATWLPWLVIGLPAGAWVDAWPPRRVMIGANVAALLTLASIPIAHAAGVLTLQQLVVGAFVIGTATVFFRAAYSKLVVQIVPAEQRPRANSLLFGSENAAHTVGPSLGGVLAQVVGAVLGVLANVGGLVVSTLCLLGVRVQRAPASTAPHEPLRRRVVEGLRLVFGDRHLRFFTLQGSVANFGLTGQQTVLVLWLTRDLGLTPATVGLLFGLSSVGGIAGALLAPGIAARLGDARAVAVTLSLAGLAVPALALAGPGAGIVVATVASVLTAAGVTGANVTRRSWIQGYVPARMLGRQATSAQVLNFGSMPVAAAVAGALGESWDLRHVVLLMGAVALVANLLVWTAPWLRRRDLPARPLDQDEVELTG